MKQPKHLIELARLFSEDATLKEEIKKAIDNPKAFILKNNTALAERGITKPNKNLPLLALVEGLAIRNLLRELDWKDDPEDAIAVVLELTKDLKDYEEIAKMLNDIEPLINDDIEEFLPTLNMALKAHTVQLVWLDINSDSYPLTLLDLNLLSRAKELALAAGYGMIK